MSGGSYDYAFTRVEDMASNLRDTHNPLRLAFKKHLLLVAKAMRDVEWEDSCDGADWEVSVRACLAPGAEIEAATAMLRESIDVANAVMSRAEGGGA